MAERRYILTKHARRRVALRRLKAEWLSAALSEPDREEPDRTDPTLQHALKRIGNRVLRVIYNSSTDPVVVVTAYFDRGLKGML